MPHLSQVTLFGPAEYFLVAILNRNCVCFIWFCFKGLLSGAFGLLISTIRIDQYSGFPRFTFDFVGFEAGLGILPAIIGLFAFAQALELSEGEAKNTISGVQKLSWRIWPDLGEIFRLRWSLIRGWSVGLVMGIIPAAGGSVAQWIAYAWEIRRAKPGDKFGEGEPKGLAATEGSNNGVTGTSLVPMFVLGIPGGISAAVIFGALMIHGLQPGLRLFKNSPEIIYTMWGLLQQMLLWVFRNFPRKNNGLSHSNP